MITPEQKIDILEGINQEVDRMKIIMYFLPVATESKEQIRKTTKALTERKRMLESLKAWIESQ